MIVDKIMSRRPMLREYFHTEISDEGMLETLPLLLKGYTLNLDKLPLLLMRLGPQVCQCLSTEIVGISHDFVHDIAPPL